MGYCTMRGIIALTGAGFRSPNSSRHPVSNQLFCLADALSAPQTNQSDNYTPMSRRRREYPVMHPVRQQHEMSG